MSYSAAAEKPHGKVGTADRIKYFANHQPSVLGKLDKCYQQWANLKGVACTECAQLADLFSFGVDSVKTGEQCSACESGAHGENNIISCSLHAKLRQCFTNQKPVVAIVKMGSYGRYKCSSLCPQVLRASLTLQHALTPSN